MAESASGAAAEPAERPRIGWREWVPLPRFGQTVKVKVDTGARTSSLHAFEIAEAERDGQPVVEFSLHPIQKDDETTVRLWAPLVEQREVRPSSGEPELRYVVLTDVTLHGVTYEVELTLTRRDQMGFRMLLGRHAIRDRFLVDPKRSYLTQESKTYRRELKQKEKRD